MRMNRMNKTLLIASLLLGLTTLIQAQPVSRETARRAATTFLDNNGAKTAQLTDVSAKVGFANLYVFTTDQSFVILSADSRVQPVLGYSFDNAFLVDIPDNLRWWLQGYEDAIASAMKQQTRRTATVAQQWEDLIAGRIETTVRETIVDPLVTTKWAQGSPYNNLCPSNSVTGCVATAMAQVMKYHDAPSIGIGSHSYYWNSQTVSANFCSSYYDWENMTNTYSSSSTEAQRQAVATLMYHCGVSVEMKYSQSESGSNNRRASFALQTFFNYNAEYHQKTEFDESEWIAMIKADLDNLNPVIYGGEGSPGGHSFVCDGYDDSGKFHFNFGWGGGSDGFYTLSGNNFPNRQDAVFNISQKTFMASSPVNLSYSQDNNLVSLTWNAANDATSYAVYRNNILIANTPDCQYNDDADWGENIYFVRGMDDNELLSLPSESVIVTVDAYQPIVDDLASSCYGSTALLTWSHPSWHPNSSPHSLSYVERIRPEKDSWVGWNIEGLHLFWGVRHTAEDLADFAGKAIGKVAFYIYQPGTFQILVYQGTTEEQLPDSLMTQQSVTTTGNGWIDVLLDSPVIVDSNEDLWFFVHNTDGTTTGIPSLATEAPHGQYWGSYIGDDTIFPHEGCNILPVENFKSDWFIVAYLTDDIYTYNLYRDDEPIANAIADTHYADSGLADGSYTYHVTTNYYGGETEPSNSVTVTVPGLVTQTVELSATWTWWTPVVTTTLAELEAAIGSNGILIKSQDGGFVRCENGQWSGTLQDFVPGQMYRIATQEADTFTLTGMPVTTAGISILQGYNWFGYMGMQPADITTALGGFTPALNDQIIGQEGAATYNGSEWTGGLTTLVPGKGYVYHSTASERKTLLIGQ